MKKLYLLALVLLLSISLSAQFVGTGIGLNGEYWKGGTNYGEPESEEFKRDGAIATKELERIDALINFQWGDANPFDETNTDFPFCCKWTGYIQADYTGLYEINQAIWDDGSGIIIWDIDDEGNAVGEPLVELIDWEPFRFNVPTRKVDIDMEEGKFYKIELRHYENEYGASAVLRWMCWDYEYTLRVVPQSQLYPTFEGSGIYDNNNTKVKVHGTKGGVSVEGLSGEPVSVYNITGVQVANIKAADVEMFIELSAGMYIVKAGGKSTKILIK